MISPEMLDLPEFSINKAGPKQRAPPTPAKGRGRQVFSEQFSQHAVPVTSAKKDSYKLSPSYKRALNMPYLQQCFEKVTLLGEGSFGMVYKGLCKDDGKWYAIKKFKKRFRNSLDRDIRLNEVHRYEKIPQCNYCVQFVKAWEEDGYLFIQMELCSISLDQYRHSKAVEEEHVWKILLDLLLGIRHLHAHQFIHLDIKPDNILVSKNEVFKLGDFGLMLDLSNENVTNAQEGDARYLAPEVLNGLFSKEADIFSLGITILEIAAHIELPSSGPLWHVLRRGTLPKQFVCNISDELCGVIELMMSPLHSDRPQVGQLLQHHRLRKLQISRSIQTVTCGMVETLKSWYHFGKAAVLNYGLGIYRSLQLDNSYMDGKKCITHHDSEDDSFTTMRRTPDRQISSDCSSTPKSSPASNGFYTPSGRDEVLSTPSRFQDRKKLLSRLNQLRRLSFCKRKIFQDDCSSQEDYSLDVANKESHSSAEGSDAELNTPMSQDNQKHLACPRMPSAIYSGTLTHSRRNNDFAKNTFQFRGPVNVKVNRAEHSWIPGTVYGVTRLDSRTCKNGIFQDDSSCEEDRSPCSSVTNSHTPIKRSPMNVDDLHLLEPSWLPRTPNSETSMSSSLWDDGRKRKNSYPPAPKCKRIRSTRI